MPLASLSFQLFLEYYAVITLMLSLRFHFLIFFISWYYAPLLPLSPCFSIIISFIFIFRLIISSFFRLFLIIISIFHFSIISSFSDFRYADHFSLSLIIFFITPLSSMLMPLLLFSCHFRFIIYFSFSLLFSSSSLIFFAAFFFISFSPLITFFDWCRYFPVIIIDIFAIFAASFFH